MFQFSKEFFKVGGKVLIPDSCVSKVDFGEIVELNNMGMFVKYFKGTTKEQQTFYRWQWLQDQYGPKKKSNTEDLNDEIPFNLH